MVLKILSAGFAGFSTFGSNWGAGSTGHVFFFFGVSSEHSMQKPGCKARSIARKLSRCGWVSFRLKAFHSDVLASRLRSLAASCRIFSRKYVMAASKLTPSPQAKGISWWHASIAFWSMASGKRPLLHTPDKDIRSGATIKYAGKCLEAAVFHDIPTRKGHRHCKLRCPTWSHQDKIWKHGERF